MRPGIDHIGVGVGAVITDGNGRVLLAKRGPRAKNQRGLRENPGGTVEFGETLRDALRRELHEELGIEVEIVELLRICDHILPDERQHWVSPTFVVRILAGEPRIREPEKCSAVRWFALDQLPPAAEMTTISRQDLELYRSRGAESQRRT